MQLIQNPTWKILCGVFVSIFLIQIVSHNADSTSMSLLPAMQASGNCTQPFINCCCHFAAICLPKLRQAAAQLEPEVMHSCFGDRGIDFQIVGKWLPVQRRVVRLLDQSCPSYVMGCFSARLKKPPCYKRESLHFPATYCTKVHDRLRVAELCLHRTVLASASTAVGTLSLPPFDSNSSYCACLYVSPYPPTGTLRCRRRGERLQTRPKTSDFVTLLGSPRIVFAIPAPDKQSVQPE